MAGTEMQGETLPPEPPDHTMLVGIDPTPGYEGRFVGVWHRRDDGAWVKDAEHHWFSSYCYRSPGAAYTWAEALERGADPTTRLAIVDNLAAARRTSGRQ